METQEPPAQGFVQKRLPWLIAAGALILYLVTLAHWMRPDTVAVVSRAAGWNQQGLYTAPLLTLVLLPFRLLPVALQPVALNVLAAVWAALAMAMLVRSIALLPFDRTREARSRNRDESGLLRISDAWIPPLFAALVLGLQMTFWQDATAGTGEMLDLVLFAYVIRCLLEFRLDRRDSWLFRMAFVYGLAVTNNYAMIAFFPACLIALVWIMGFQFFRVRFLTVMTVCGLAGLLGYLVLPILGREQGVSFGAHLRSELVLQKHSLLAVPQYVVLLLSLQVLLPVFLMGFRWRTSSGDTSAAGAVMSRLVQRFVHVLMLLMCLSVFLDLRWGPRQLGMGLQFLPFFYLAALGVGYYAGYILLTFRSSRGKGRHREQPSSAFVNGVVLGLTFLLAAGEPLYLVVKNLPALTKTNGPYLHDMARLMVQSVPTQGAYLLSDGLPELLMAHAVLAQQGEARNYVFVRSSLLIYPAYQELLARQYPGRWSALSHTKNLPATLPGAYVTHLLTTLSRSNAVFYLHPSVGYFFESMQLHPRGLIYRVTPLPKDPLAYPRVQPAEIALNQKFWEDAEPILERLPTASTNDPPALRYVRQAYARALDYWGVALQRAQPPKGTQPTAYFKAAEKWFALAERIDPSNVAARMNAQFAAQLSSGKPISVDLSQPVDLPRGVPDWTTLVEQQGPVDNPAGTFALARLYASGGSFRQALSETRWIENLLNVLAGTSRDSTNNQAALETVQRWRRDMQTMVWLEFGDSTKALTNAQAMAKAHPKDNGALNALYEVYLSTGRITNALAVVKQQLELNPKNSRALLNLAFLNIHLKQFQPAIQAMDSLLAQDPQDSAARLNRAIAYLQSGQLEKAQSDYEKLKEVLPKNFAIYYGLANIAIQQKDRTAALKNYRLYLKYAPQGTAEYKAVTQRVASLEGQTAR